MEPTSLAALVLLVLTALLMAFFAYRTQRAGLRPAELRPIAAFNTLKRLIGQAVEAGHKLHLGLGSGGIATITTAETLAGLTLLDYIADQTAAAGTPPIVSTADPATLLLAQERLRQAHQPGYVGRNFRATDLRWLSTEPAAYAAGVMGLQEVEDLAGSVLLGHFGDEYLLMAESANRQKPPLSTIAGASDPNVLPYVFATAPKGLWAEEMFAAGAYLSRKPFHIGSLFAQDTLRWIIGWVIIGGVLLKAFGLIG